MLVLEYLFGDYYLSFGRVTAYNLESGMQRTVIDDGLSFPQDMAIDPRAG